jgi:uncharacterized membrane protein HdeD (DUF308 family)
MNIVAENKTIKELWIILLFTYGLVPIIAGLDKFVHLLADWEIYLSPAALSIIPFEGHTFMILVGVIEIVAGIIVFVKPKIGAYVVMGWLVAIAINLVLARYYDIAVRDLSMAVGALTLAKLSVQRR